MVTPAPTPDSSSAFPLSSGEANKPLSLQLNAESTPPDVKVEINKDGFLVIDGRAHQVSDLTGNPINYAEKTENERTALTTFWKTVIAASPESFKTGFSSVKVNVQSEKRVDIERFEGENKPSTKVSSLSNETSKKIYDLSKKLPVFTSALAETRPNPPLPPPVNSHSQSINSHSQSSPSHAAAKQAESVALHPSPLPLNISLAPSNAASSAVEQKVEDDEDDDVSDEVEEQEVQEVDESKMRTRLALDDDD